MNMNLANPLRWPWQIKAGLGAAMAGFLYVEYYRARARYNAALEAKVKEAASSGDAAPAGGAKPAAAPVASGSSISELPDEDVGVASSSSSSSSSAGASASASSSAGASGDGDGLKGAKTEVQADGRVMLNTEDMSPQQRQQLQQLLMLISTGEKLISLRAFNEAEHCLVSALEMVQTTLGREHILGDRPFQLLSQLYTAQGEEAKALAMLSQSHAIRVVNMGPTSPVTAQAIIAMAQLLLELQRFDEAEKYAYRALQIYEDLPAEDGPALANKTIQLATAKFLLAKVHKANNELESAVELLNHVTEVAVKHVGKATIFAIHALCTKASVLRLMDDFAGAEAIYLDLLAELDGANTPRESPVRNAVANHLASMHWDSGNLEQAALSQAEVEDAAKIPPTTDSRFLHTLNAIYFYTLRTQADLDAIAAGEEPAPVNLGEAIMAEDAGNAPPILERSAHAVLKFRLAAHPVRAQLAASDSDSLFLTVTLEGQGDDAAPIELSKTITADDLAAPIEFTTEPTSVCAAGMTKALVQVYTSEAKDALVGQHHQLVYAPFDIEAVTVAQAHSYSDISSFVQFSPEQQ